MARPPAPGNGPACPGQPTTPPAGSGDPWSHYPGDGLHLDLRIGVVKGCLSGDILWNPEICCRGEGSRGPASACERIAAINDPAIAVQVLDTIESLPQVLVSRDLDVAQVTDSDSNLRLMLAVP